MASGKEVFSLSPANYSTEGGLYSMVLSMMLKKKKRWGNIITITFYSFAKEKPKILTIKNCKNHDVVNQVAMVRTATYTYKIKIIITKKKVLTIRSDTLQIRNAKTQK